MGKKNRSTVKKKHANFVHLRVCSSYSLLEGAIKTDDLTKLCSKNNMPAIAVTDKGNLFGLLEFCSSCTKNGIQPIVGCVINIFHEEHKVISNTNNLLLLAKNTVGYQNLLKLVSKSYLERGDESAPGLKLSDLEGFASGLIAFTGGPDGIVGQHILNNQLDAAEEVLEKLNRFFPERLYVELMRHGLESEEKTEKSFIDFAYKHNLPLVATNDVHFSDKKMFEAHDALICIADGTYVLEENRRKFTLEHYFKSAQEMTELFSDIPEAIENTLVIAKRCAVMAEEHPPMLPHFSTEGGRGETEELKFVATEGLKKRLEENVFTEKMSKKEKEVARKPYFKRLEYELGVINKMEFPGYFLIVSDFILWSKSKGIPVGPGRGSGAGSVVAWSLQITNLDPLMFGLLFERFLNPERVSMPDFDIDFCQERRDEVIKYVQKKYGEDKVAQIITFGKLQARAVLRDVGRVLHMPYSQVDKICKMIPFNPIAPVTLSQAIKMDPVLQEERDSDEQVKKLLDIGLKLEGLNRHASTHAAGVVIADRPLNEVVALYSDQKSSIPVTQYSMKPAEKAGLVKFDFLGLKTLTVISRACKLLTKQGIEIDIDKITFDDELTFKMLAEGKTTGVFQMESAGMRDALRKMKPDSIEDIIALISLYRPGPMENIPTYIARKHGKERPDYLHPKLKDTLKETFGVIIYQEQVMQIAQVLAGYSLGAADLLRRAMGKKIKAEMDAQREMFIDGAIKNDVSKKQASDIFDLVAKFAGYGFNKSHAAAYAVIGYQTAYLKANYPVEFFTASMNIDIGDTDKINIFCEETTRSGIKILPPDINKSGTYFKTEKLPEIQITGRQRAIRYALGALKNVGIHATQELEQERDNNGDFKNIFDFAGRCTSKAVNKRQIESLAKAGAFDLLNDNRKQMFESASTIISYNQAIMNEKQSNQVNLFDLTDNVAGTLPVLEDTKDWEEKERIHKEFEAIGFFLNNHPLDSYRKELDKLHIVWAANLDESVQTSGIKIKMAGIVTHTTHRSSGNKRFAYLQLSDPTGITEISVFDENLISVSRELLESKEPLFIESEARKDEGGIRLQAEKIVSLDTFLEQQKYHLKIILDHTTSMEKIKALLKQQDKGRAKISFVTMTSEGMGVEIQLPGHFAIDSNSIKTISSIPGVKKVFEN